MSCSLPSSRNGDVGTREVIEGRSTSTVSKVASLLSFFRLAVQFAQVHALVDMLARYLSKLPSNGLAGGHCARSMTKSNTGTSHGRHTGDEGVTFPCGEAQPGQTWMTQSRLWTQRSAAELTGHDVVPVRFSLVKGQATVVAEL